MNNDTKTVNSVIGHRCTLCHNCIFKTFFDCLLLWFLLMGVWGVKEVKKTASSILATKSATLLGGKCYHPAHYPWYKYVMVSYMWISSCNEQSLNLSSEEIISTCSQSSSTFRYLLSANDIRKLVLPITVHLVHVVQIQICYKSNCDIS